MAELTVEKAKEFLQSQGYFVGNLWSVNDVQNMYKCSDEQAQEVLDDVFNGEWLCGEINQSIQIVADAMGLEEADEDDE